MKIKTALTVIVKASDDSEAVQLVNMLSTVNGYVDRIYLQLNAPKGKKIHPRMREIADKYGDVVQEYVWHDSFVDARNALMEKVDNDTDWIIWLDTDDVVEHPEMITPSLSAMPDDVHGIYILYDYQRDEYGNVLVSHWNVRAVRYNGSYTWKSSFDDDKVSVHETLIAKRNVRAVANNEWKVVHVATPEHYKDSLQRNITLLEGMAARQVTTTEGVDPRILFYLGSHYNEAYRFNEALELFIQYLQVSGWSEERAEAHVYVGRILKNKGHTAQARTAFLQAIGENPENPGAYLELGKLESASQRWKQSMQWLERGVQLKAQITPMVRYSYDFELYTEYANTLSNLGGKHIPKALRMAQKALDLRPYDEQAKENRDRVQDLVEYRNLVKSTNTLLRQFGEDDTELLGQFLNGLPERVQDSPLVVEAKNKNLPITNWSDNSVVIYAGFGPLGIWGPWSLNETGTGGSEEAIIRMSDELTDLGYDVTVFGMPGKKAGTYNKVHWRHYWEINSKDRFNVLISWRQPAFFDYNWNAKKRYLWLHDVMKADELTPERLDNLDKVIYVSQYHADRPENGHIPNSKKLASANGILPDTFTFSGDKPRRDNHRIIYMSANERGLRILLDIWPDIRIRVPDATLTPYYGWESFDSVNRDNPERMAWKATMIARMKELDGVEESVRIPQDKLIEEMYKSGIWAYPSFFPEVSCITAMKAQAAGCIPVTSTYANLKDVVSDEFGIKVDMGDFTPEDVERYKKELIKALLHRPIESRRTAMKREAKERFAWSNVAKQWNEEFNS